MIRYLITGAAALAFTALTSPTAMAAPSAEDFGKMPMVSDAAISPDGTRLALYANFDGTPGIQIFDLADPGATAKGALLPKDTFPRWIKWANNERIIASAAAPVRFFGTPTYSAGLYSVEAASGKAKMLVKPPRQNGLGSRVGGAGADGDYIELDYADVIDFLPDDPDHIIMAFMDRRQWQRDAQRVNVKTGAFKSIKTGSASIQDWVTDQRGELRVGQGLRSEARETGAENYYLQIRDADTDTWKTADDYPGLDANAPIYGFTSDPNEMVIGDYRGRDTRGLYVYDLGAKSITRKIFHHDTYDATDLVYEDGEVIGARYRADTMQTDLLPGFDSTMNAIRTQYPGFSVDYVDSADDGRTILYKISNATEPGALMIQRADGKTQKIADYRPDLKPDDLGLVIPVKYTARDGERIPAYVTLPPTVNDTAAIKSLPFIIMPHGGPYARDGLNFDYLAQFFATRGYGVLQMNFRGSTGYGKKYEAAGRDNWKVMQHDVEDGAKWLLAKGYADPDRFCIAGWSYGGYAALMGAIEAPDMYDCAISIAGVTDLKDLRRDQRKYRFGRISAGTIFSGVTDKDVIRANSPTKMADQMKVPVFLAHGTDDVNVHIDQYRRMKSALKKADVKVKTMEFKGVDHYFENQEDRQKLLVEIDKWLVATMGPSEFVKK